MHKLLATEVNRDLRIDYYSNTALTDHFDMKPICYNVTKKIDKNRLSFIESLGKIKVIFVAKFDNVGDAITNTETSARGYVKKRHILMKRRVIYLNFDAIIKSVVPKNGKINSRIYKKLINLIKEVILHEAAHLIHIRKYKIRIRKSDYMVEIKKRRIKNFKEIFDIIGVIKSSYGDISFIRMFFIKLAFLEEDFFRDIESLFTEGFAMRFDTLYHPITENSLMKDYNNLDDYLNRYKEDLETEIKNFDYAIKTLQTILVPFYLIKTNRLFFGNKSTKKLKENMKNINDLKNKFKRFKDTIISLDKHQVGKYMVSFLMYNSYKLKDIKDLDFKSFIRLYESVSLKNDLEPLIGFKQGTINISEISNEIISKQKKTALELDLIIKDLDGKTFL